MKNDKTLTPKEIRNIFDDKDYSALKRFGQNFLVDDAAISAIGRAVMERAGDGMPVYEIGPGLGSLTRKLILAGASVKAFEIDKGFCAFLRDGGYGDKLEIIEGDVLETLFSGIHKPSCLCGNLPYNVGTLLTIRILEGGISGSYPDNMVFLLQKEVADKFCAKEGDRNYSSLAILTSLSYDCNKLFDVKPGSFFPVPKVMSSLIAFRRKAMPIIGDAEEKRSFVRLMRSCFANRRKTLKNNLQQAGYSDAQDLLDKAGIDSGKRAETLTLQDFLRLHDGAVFGKLD